MSPGPAWSESQSDRTLNRKDSIAHFTVYTQLKTLPDLAGKLLCGLKNTASVYHMGIRVMFKHLYLPNQRRD